MNKIKWSAKGNYPVLTNETCNNITPPRPVFHEELDMLEAYKYIEYPKSPYPLMWASSTKYYYKGDCLFRIKVGDRDNPSEITMNGYSLIKPVLEPVNISDMILNNIDKLKELEDEAIQYIRDTHNDYKNKADMFTVAFSGGKDAQVVLELVSRAIPDEEFTVIFIDTKMELPPTYEIWDSTKESYNRRNSKIKFETASNEVDVLDMWRKFGHPSRMLRWCCTVMKTAPYMKLAKSLIGKHKGLIVSFIGVRSEESFARSKYERTPRAGKNNLQTSAHVILEWNLTEVFMYMFYANITLNDNYRMGMLRVGCTVCPFAGGRHATCLEHHFRDIAKPYYDIIEEQSKLCGLKDGEELHRYVTQHLWTRRGGGGYGIDTYGTSVVFTSVGSNFNCVINNPRESITEWLKILGDVSVSRDGDNTHGLIKTNNDNVVSFSITPNNTGVSFSSPTKADTLFGLLPVSDTSNVKGKLKKILHKAAYCVHCGACLTVCPKGAISIVSNKIKVDSKLCIHCMKCADKFGKGCLAAASVSIASTPIGKPKTQQYKRFAKYMQWGMREEWLSGYLQATDDWFGNCGLLQPQIESFIFWAQDSGVITYVFGANNHKELTELGKAITKIYDTDTVLVWEILWINMYYSNPIIRWFLEDYEYNNPMSIEDTVQYILESQNVVYERGIRVGIISLVDLFRHTPYGSRMGIGVLDTDDGELVIQKKRRNHAHPLSICYFIYKKARMLNKYSLNINDFYDDIDQMSHEQILSNCDNNIKRESPYALFGMDRTTFITTLKLLDDHTNLLRLTNGRDGVVIELVATVSDDMILSFTEKFANL